MKKDMSSSKEFLEASSLLQIINPLVLQIGHYPVIFEAFFLVKLTMVSLIILAHTCLQGLAEQRKLKYPISDF